METYRLRYLDGAAPLLATELVREFMGIGLRAAKELVETRGVILDEVSAADARRVAARFAAIGAEVEIEQTWRHSYAYDPRDSRRADQPIKRLRAGVSELAIDQGQLGALGPGAPQAFADAASLERRVAAQLEHWRERELLVAASEIEVLEALSARNVELEAKLREDPSDLANHLIYGDWLQSRGDPRGQLVALQHALAAAEGTPAAAELRAREREYRRQHLSHLFGPLRRVADVVTVSWSLGFIDAAFIGSSAPPLPTLAALLRLPVAARLRSLGLTTKLLWHPRLEQVLCQSEVTTGLRELELGDHIHRGQQLEPPLNFSRLWTQLRSMRKLTICHERPPLRSLHSSTLEHLELRMLGLPDPEFVEELRESGPRASDSHTRHFVAGRLPRLRTLTLDFESAEDMSPVAFADLLALPEFDGVTELNLRLPANRPVPVAVAKILASIPRLSLLERLDLSGCVVDERGMEALLHARSRGRLPAQVVEPYSMVAS